MIDFNGIKVLQSVFWTSVQSVAPKRNNDRFEAVRLPVSAGRLPGGRAALLTPFVTYVWHKFLLSSLSHNPAYVPGPTFGLVKLLGSSGSHCTKWTDEQHRPAGFESRLIPDLSLPFISTLIGLRAFVLVSILVWWETLANTGMLTRLGLFHT